METKKESPKKHRQQLDERELNPDPIRQFEHWFAQHSGEGGGRWRTIGIALYNVWQAIIGRPPAEVNAIAVATATNDGKVSARMMLLKDVDSDGFVFYTNYNSVKGKELSENPFAALVFYWPELGRQVRIEGSVEKVSPEESDAYFATRARESQIGAHASAQSEVLGSREELDRRFKELEQQYHDRPIPRPPHWGGYRVKPIRIEFWQVRLARLHDRILYERQKDGSWTMKRLAP